MSSNTLDKSMSSSLKMLSELIHQETDRSIFEKLERQYNALSRMFQKKIYETVPKDTEEYRKANTQMRKAVGKLEEAIASTGKIPEAINQIATAIDLVGKIATV